MFRITFNVGVGFDKDGEPIPNGIKYDAIDSIESRLIRDGGGYTSITTEGGYRHNSGHNVMEEGRQYVVLAQYGEPEMGHDAQHALAVHWARDMAQFMRRALNQESVLVTVESVQFEFVS